MRSVLSALAYILFLVVWVLVINAAVFNLTFLQPDFYIKSFDKTDSYNRVINTVTTEEAWHNKLMELILTRILALT